MLYWGLVQHYEVIPEWFGAFRLGDDVLKALYYAALLDEMARSYRPSRRRIRLR